jgi:hypothetical protein
MMRQWPCLWQIPLVTFLRWLVLSVATVVAVGATGCKDTGGSAADITQRAWDAHSAVIGAGEAARTCAEAGPAMQKEIAARRDLFVAAVALDNDRQKLAEATAWIEAHEDRYKDLETRMAALSDRCADDATVQAAFEAMSNP